jgi:thymidylate synthase
MNFASQTRHHPTPGGPAIVYQGEQGYLTLLADIMEYGSEVPDRTGVGRIKLFDRFLRFDLREGFPLLTHRNAPPRYAFREFWAFLNGITHIHTYLSAAGINFWKGNTTREFLDQRGLTFLPVGHGGKSYGFQVRHFGGDYDDDFNGRGGVDQLANIYHTLKNDPFSSRILLSMWNPQQEAEMALPPCWWAHQFLVTLDKSGNQVLNLALTSRSADLLFGTPFNVAQYAIYLAAMAHATGMIAGELSCRLTDVHIYGKRADLNPDVEPHKSSQVRYVQETLTRIASESKIELTFNRPIDSLDDLLSLDFDRDLRLTGYTPDLTEYITPRPAMAV